MVDNDVIHWTHKERPMEYPYVRAVVCQLWGSCSDRYKSEFELAGDAASIGFAGVSVVKIP